MGALLALLALVRDAGYHSGCFVLPFDICLLFRADAGFVFQIVVIPHEVVTE